MNVYKRLPVKLHSIYTNTQDEAETLNKLDHGKNIVVVHSSIKEDKSNTEIGDTIILLEDYL